MSKADWNMEQWRNYYEGLRQKAYNNYQESGEKRYDSQEHKYSVIVDAFDGYLENKREVDAAKRRRQTNIDAYIDRYTSSKSDYTRDEVVNLLRGVKDF